MATLFDLPCNYIVELKGALTAATSAEASRLLSALYRDEPVVYDPLRFEIRAVGARLTDYERAAVPPPSRRYDFEAD